MPAFDAYQHTITLACDLPGPQRGAEFAAAAKRYKQAVVLGWLDKVAKIERLDLTPTLANHIIKGWMGRSISRRLLIQWFAQTGRTAANKSKDHECRDMIIQRYAPEVRESLRKAEKHMEAAREAITGG